MERIGREVERELGRGGSSDALPLAALYETALFIGGVIAYANEVKTKELGVEPMLLMEHGAESAPVAEAMAEAGIASRCPVCRYGSAW